MFPGVVVIWLLLYLPPLLALGPGELRFSRSLYNLSIPENSVGKAYARQPPGEETLGLQLPASSKTNIEVNYRIVNGDKNKFFKAEERLVGDFCFLLIRIRTGNSDVLNRERKEKYTLEVRASVSRRDGKNKLLLETDTTVIVKILDTNDLSPLFYPTEYTVTIPEDTPLHKSIAKVNAEDADIGLNGEIYYSFLDDTHQFAIHPSSGIVTVTRPLTLTERMYHELVILGKDRGALFQSTGSSHAARAKLTVKIKKVNLFGPEIYVKQFTDIVENSREEIYAIVRVVDKDEGIHGKIKSLEIVDGDPDGHFRIRSGDRPGEYNILVHPLLDREKTPQGYNLTLKAVDRGIPPKQSYKSVPVHLVDINDNVPVFHKEIYEVNVPETAPVNTPVIRLKVADIDLGKNAKVFLEIVGGNEGGEFYVNPDTGMLYTAVILDAEAKAFYTLTVSAIDQGNTGTRKQSSAKVKINVLDTNDNDPLFEKHEVKVRLDENESPGTYVTKVTARDRDSGENAYISYSIANLNPVPFEIDHFSGIVKTTQVLDFESMKREYILRVRASDWGLPYRRQTEMQLTIKINDVNDNRPQFEKIDCSSHISRHLPLGTEIFTLSAIDLDAGSIITYQITSGNDDNCFNIDSSSGVLIVTCDLKKIKYDEIDINITATDGTHLSDVMKVQLHLAATKKTTSSGRHANDEIGQFQCKDTGVARRLADVLASAEKSNVQVRDASQEEFAMMPSRYGENVHAPEFSDFPLEIKVNESVNLGTTLTRVKAKDRDLGYNGKLIFGISGGDKDSVFRIDPETGDLKVIGYLDRERENQYFLNVSVFDLGKPQKGLSRVLPITVLDINDNAPKFDKILSKFKVLENAINGTMLCKLKATDADTGEFSKIKYHLITDTTDFSIHQMTGALSVSGPLDREKQQNYELIIRAKDNGGLYSDAIVNIVIEDINDNPPKFSLPSFFVKVREDVPRGAVVIILNAIDPDLGLGGEIKYSVIEHGDYGGFFKIDALTGTVRTLKSLDFEERQIHNLVIRAADRGVPSLFSETSVVIEIIDVNENLYSPVFDDFVLEGSVRENQPVGTRVLTIKASDADPPGMDSRITYSVKGGSGMGFFSVDNEGQIRTLAVLDTETQEHYWLTVCAQDQGVVPLHSCVKVYIVIEDENDCVPLTVESTYRAQVSENIPGGRFVLQLTAQDLDSSSHLAYRILSGDPAGLFQINTTTGVISTSGRLDREAQPQYSLEVQVSDGGDPLLSSTSRVLIDVMDLNDHSPVFLEQYYSIRVPAGRKNRVHIKDQNSTKAMSPDKDITLGVGDEAMPWDIHNGELRGFSVFRVLAHDDDEGQNGMVTYSTKPGKGKNIFQIHPSSGVVFSNDDLEVGSSHELNIRASDNGIPPKVTTTRVTVEVLPLPTFSPNSPVVVNLPLSVKVTESDKVGFLVALIQAIDEDNDTLWYDIVDGNSENNFYIGQENGNILLAKKLIWEQKSNYSLNISITDGFYTIFTKLNVLVVNDVNEQGPVFSQAVYVVNVSENFAGGSPILSLRASGQDNLLYSIHNAQSLMSLKIFKIDSLTGDITIKEPLDRETMEVHLLTVTVRDQAIKPKRSYTRVLVRVYDHNDHAPEFNSKIIQGKVYETSPVGTSIVKILASDKDKGDNALISYSITSGNIGNIFSIDSEMGDLTLAHELDLNSAFEYMLQVKASNPGPNSLSSSIPVHIMVTMADNAKPRFLKQMYTADIYENEPIGTLVTHIEARSTSSLLFDIVNGNTNDAFNINPSTGVLTTKGILDYEDLQIYNLTITATNMGGISSESSILIHILDRNDNAPIFKNYTYYGSVLESAPIGSLIFSNTSNRLVLTSEDKDSGTNGIITFEIVEIFASKYFHIDSSTGAIKTMKMLDYETNKNFIFHVRAHDLGVPKLFSETLAKVNITVIDVNDCPPKFSQQDYNVSLLLPTYKNVALITLTATDADTPQELLKYDIIDGDKKNIFAVDQLSGTVTVVHPDRVKQIHKIHVRVSDGKHSSISQLYIAVENSESSGLRFQRPAYEGSVMENSTKIMTVTVVNVLGSALNEHIEFHILNPTDMFSVGLTSGAIQTTGVKFDRETKDNYVLIVEAKSSLEVVQNQHTTTRVVHVVVNVTVMDVNDNCPMFVNLPYYAIVSVEDEKGHVIAKVHAIDLDCLENGEVRYEMKRGHGELFKVCRKTGEISLKQNLEGHNKEYQLIIGAYDGGVTPCYSETTVNVKVVDRSMPVFDKQFYSLVVKENIEVFSPLGEPLLASSPLGRKLIYSIVQGNEKEKFTLDFNTAPDSNNGPCVIFATEELDYEDEQLHQLTVRATDSVTGIFAEVTVAIVIDDVNDCPPEFSADSYHISVSEASPFGTLLSKMEAYDNDTGINKDITYSMSTPGNNASLYFHVDPTDGSIYLKKSLDRETYSTHHFSIVATDKGLPSLSSTVHVWVSVLDMNDNAPFFEQSVYACVISQHATRGQFVTRVAASDPDVIDQGRLTYSIVGGNDRQTFYVNHTNGDISLVNIEKFGNHGLIILNVSVSDGVYTSFCRVKISLHPANKHIPQFIHALQEASAMENKPPGLLVAVVKAEDEDFGKYGLILYSIPSNYIRETFALNSQTGEITTLVKLDRESQSEYDIPIMATDGGGKSTFTTVKVKVEDENDNPPIFIYNEYKKAIHLNQSLSKTILQVKAVDLDDGNNGEIAYSFYDAENSGIIELFEINTDTGAISLISTMSTWESQVYQFWVRATDRGVPFQQADVSVEIYIVSPSDEIPVFDIIHDKYFVVENSIQGTVITHLKMTTDIPVAFRVVASNYDSSLFHIDSTGQLIISGTLDREKRDSYAIGVLAETTNTPAIVSFTEIILNVIDENDNAPFFHSSPLYLLLAENIELGTTIIRVQAEDHDFGSNGEIRYALGADTGVVGNVFAIDPFTGWISTLTELDRETQPMYKFQVIATDNGHQKHVTRMTVIVRLKDYNDCPPIFTKQIYLASVKEDAKPGTIVMTLEITDDDLDITPIEFYIISGDPQCQFHIRASGEVYVTKGLDRESVAHYALKIIATDGTHTATTTVSIEILDVNDNPPYCIRHRYYEKVPENAAVGTSILTVLASDADEEQNSKLRYFLSGFKSEHFAIEKNTGEIKTATLLDRENIWKYNLVAHVQDKEKTSWECTCEINIHLSDINDNAPQFSISQYSVTLPEDVEVGTLVMKVHAVDKDQGINRIVRYTLIDNLHGQFAITPNSGIITVLAPLDRETKSVFNLEVRAADRGSPSLWSQAMIHLTVSDVNDNPPEFGTKTYFTVVPEINPIGTEIIRVLATSKDSGINADIFYSIISGNEHKKFVIDAKTGIIAISDTLDYEKTKEYLLTIQAMDRGTPPLSNVATVNVTVIDSNDNAPIFRQNAYAVQVREDTEVSSNILQVIANDLDSGSNGNVFYSIEKGDLARKFSVNPITGQVSIISPLDREAHTMYVLEVLARDKGIPVLSSSVTVTIEVTDANDNPPLFSQSNYTAIIQEDKPINFLVIEFIINDKDIHPNAEPYIFDIRSGNEDSAFNLEQDGLLKTAIKFNHKRKGRYVLQIRVFDNGSPPLYSDTWVDVRIIEESQHPPVVTPLEINMNSVMDEYAGGEIGKVIAFDQDTYDKLTYNLIPVTEFGNSTPDLFRINENDGKLFALPQLDIGEYLLNVSVSDGKFTTFSTVKLFMELISDEMLRNSVVIRFREVTPKLFLMNHRKGFIRAVRNAINCHLKDIVIISIQPSSDDVNLVHRPKRSVSFWNSKSDVNSSNKTKRGISHDLDVLFSVKKLTAQGNIGYYKSETIRKFLNVNLEELEESSKLVVEEMIRVKCNAHYCAYGECQEKLILDRNNIIHIHTNSISLVSPFHEHKTECKCQDGYGGERCETIVNECARKPCPENEKCFPDKSIQGYNCRCVDRMEEGRCHLEMSKCYNGNCLKPANPVSFGGKSYAQYRIGKETLNGKRFFEDLFILSLKLKTVSLSGNLLYAAGKIDYNILEIVNGIIQYRLELGSGEGIIRVSSVKVSDGRWHEVRLERDGSSARLTVDGKHVAHGSAPGMNGILNLFTDDLFFGAEVREHPAILGLEDIQRGFLGCLGDIRVSNEMIPLHNGGSGGSLILKRLANVEFSCPTNLDHPGACGSLPCLNGGTCKNLIKEIKEEKPEYECQCHERFTGVHCELDTDPCASQPCLFGGICSPLSEGRFECSCNKNLFGRRCEMGRWCSGGGSCLHGGLCEEGDTGPTCRCHGYHGPLCEFDVDECKGDPCLNGATCINEPGSFRCVCPPDKTGMHCGNPLHSDAVTSGVYDLISKDRILWLLGAIGGTLILVMMCGVIIGCQKRQCQMPPDAKPHVLNSNLKQQQEMQIIKPRGSKLSNLEVQCSVMGSVIGERPVSYTPVSTSHDPQVILNNMDILRNYGSAGDDLENIPPDYRRNLNRDPGTANSSSCGEMDTLHKPSWSDQMHIQTFQDNRINNDLTRRLNKDDNIISPPKGYHWDCSDWCTNVGVGVPLSNIVEVPGSEVPDSSSYHSNDSTEYSQNTPVPSSKCDILPPPPNIIPFDEPKSSSSYPDEKEMTDDGYDVNRGGNYLLHPNTYLPCFTYSSTDGEVEVEQNDMDEEAGVEPYGFPSTRRRQNYKDSEIGSVITMLEEHNSLLGKGSTSDVSVNVCEIEDSDNDYEKTNVKKVKWKDNSPQHSQV